MLAEERTKLKRWVIFNVVLLILYLGFFHLCLEFPFPRTIVIGAIVAAVFVGLCVRFRKLFANRYEFLMYMVIPLDIILEGLIPEHLGYSFYICAASFWAVFFFYRGYRMINPVASPNRNAA